MKYIALIGTAAQQSYNRELLQFMKHYFSQRATIDVNEITGIPLFNEPTQNHIPATVQALNDKISQADGVDHRGTRIRSCHSGRTQERY